MCDKYLLTHYEEIIREILKDPNENKHFPVNIHFVELSGYDPGLGNDFLRDPEKSLETWDQALKKVQTDLILKSEMNNIYKNHTHCRMHSLPLYAEFHRTKFPQNGDTNKFLQVSGNVVRMTAVKMLEYQRQYICTKCKYTMMATAQYDFKNIITPPKKCKNPEECKSTSIISMGELNAEFCKDYQEIKMQEIVSKLDVGSVSSVPNSMWVTLEDDLVDSCKPGDNITVCGLVKRRQNQFIVGKKMEVELVMKANYVEVNNNNITALSITPELEGMFQGFWKTYADTPLAARDIIVKSICPQLFALYLVKLAMAVVLAGGSNLHINSNTGVKVRAEPHLLLVGDPGTGKSQLLRFASKIIPRSVLTTGVGSTAAGLTVAAIMENGEWHLEGGALVMSDGGICCIDEFNTMKAHDRTSIHEAMEQQTISVAKAGMVCKLSTRCSILAATSPKGNIDPSQPLNMNVALASPLLSRFDLILLLRDRVDDVWDSQMVDYIFSSLDNNNSSKLTENINWNIETLQAYFAVIKKIHPVLTEDSNKILASYYQAQRRKNRNKSRTTVRLLDSLVRLSQGHARLMYHEEVEIVDATVAVILVETGMESDSSLFNLHFNLRDDFPQDPTSNYRELVEIVLKKLELHDLLKKELDRPGKSKQNKPSTSSVKTTSPTVRAESKFFQIQTEAKEENTSGSSNNSEQIKKQFDKLIITETNKTRNEPDLGEGTSGISNKCELNVESSENENLTQFEISKTSDKNKGKHNNKQNPKRYKSKNDQNPKKIKLDEKKNDIQGDLAALQCIPSVNDIFRDIEDFSFNFERNDSVEAEPNSDVSTENNQNITFGSNSDQPNAEPSSDVSTKSNENITTSSNSEPKMLNAVNMLRNNQSTDIQKNKNSELSLKTKTANRFNRFKFIPKDNEPPSHKSESTVDNLNVAESTVPEKNPFENSDMGSLDVSFANVETSTQRENPTSTEKNNSFDQNLKKQKSPQKEVETSDLKSKNIPHSIFETQEEIDNLDLDI